MDNREGQYEDEINLRDYINVIIKRKVTVIVIFLVCVIAAGIYSFAAPKVYEVSQVLRPPTVGLDKYLASPAMIKERIDAELYSREIKKEAGLLPEKEFEIEVFIPKKDGFFKTILKTTGDEVEKTKSVLSILFDKLSKEYSPVIKVKLNAIKNNISLKKNQIKKNQKRIESLDKKVALIEKRIFFMESQSTKAKENTDVLVEERTNFLEEVVGEDRVSSILYTTTIQQAIGYFNQLHNQLNSLKNRREDLETTTKMMRGEIEDIQIRINDLEANKQFIQNIQQLQKPVRSIKPVAPKKKQNIAIAGVLGLFLGVFIAFFREFWVNSSNDKVKG